MKYYRLHESLRKLDYFEFPNILIILVVLCGWAINAMIVKWLNLNLSFSPNCFYTGYSEYNGVFAEAEADLIKRA